MVNTRLAARIVAVALVLASVAAILRAQHVDPKELSLSRPEHVLSGIDVTKTRLPEVEARWGKPKRTDSRVVGTDERWKATLYVWELGNVRLEVSNRTEPRNGVFVETELGGVAVWGTEPSKNGMGVTGAGLALGDPVEKVARCYGRVKWVSSSSLVVQWKDGTTLEVGIDKERRIVHMRLVSGEAE